MDFLDRNISMTPEEKFALGERVKNDFKISHRLPFTGSAIYGAGAAIPTYALSRYLGLGNVPSALLSGATGMIGAAYGYNK